MKLRSEQLEAFTSMACQQFVERMVPHIQTAFPTQYQTLGKTKVRQIVQEGIESAEQYGIEVERHVCIFIELMLAFGRHFDREQPWAYTILNDTQRLPAMRLQRLHHAAIQHVDAATRWSEMPETAQ